MITFIHTADIHYGMENYGKIDPATGIHSRLHDFDRAFNSCIDVALEKQVDFFLFCGDAYKTAHPSPTQQKLLCQALIRLQQAHIPIVAVVGNHDNPLTFGKAHSLDIFGEKPVEGFHIISKPTTVRLITKHGPINIIGIPWPTRNTVSLNKEYQLASAADLTNYISEAVSRIIKHHTDSLNPEEPAILAGHLTVANGIFSGSEKRAIYGSDPVLLPSQLAIAPLDYVALGHLHRYQNLNPTGYPAVVYAGSIERVDFGERKEDKGFCLVTIERKGSTRHTFIKSPMRPFLQFDIILQQENDQTEQILAVLAQENLENAVIKIHYHLSDTMIDSVDLQQIQKACAQAHYVVSITPVKPITTRERRHNASISMDMQTLLTSYFNTKPELKDRATLLIEKGLSYLAQAENIENE